MSDRNSIPYPSTPKTTKQIIKLKTSYADRHSFREVDTVDIDYIAQEVAECDAEIEEYERKIAWFRQKKRELQWQAVETEEGELLPFDDAA